MTIATTPPVKLYDQCPDWCNVDHDTYFDNEGWSFESTDAATGMPNLLMDHAIQFGPGVTGVQATNALTGVPTTPVLSIDIVVLQRAAEAANSGVTTRLVREFGNALVTAGIWMDYQTADDDTAALLREVAAE